ncbi:glutaredoxin [Marinomonas sp. S3726]|uniref:glutaredoxin family protein n=1 Tax=Marinomonas sp. S3726 TaxID=579484 RepID=UPI0005FA8B39|nr:glutaredoxin family protein [Marinomonas sp. S3726]KJZ14870.1 glutaredoxin [Marinomonas sp. S3726]
MKKVTLYTLNKCPHCDTAKAYLDQQGITYRLCNVQTPSGRKEFTKLGLRGVPVLKIGDQILKGFSVKAFNKLY